MPNKKTPEALLLSALFTALLAADVSHAGAREEGRLLTATEVLEDVGAMPDERLPATLLAHAYGIAVIPDVTKVAFIFGGRHGNGVLVTRDKLSGPWSNPCFVSLTGGSWGFQAGAQSSDIILVFTTKSGIEGIAGGKLTLGADASVATGPVGRQGSAGTDITFNSEIYTYARTRGLFGGIALDGSVLSIDRSANASAYRESGITATQIFAGQSPPPPATAERFLERLAEATRTTIRAADTPGAAAPGSAPAPGVPPAPNNAPGQPSNVPPAAEPARTYPLDDTKKPAP
jgi:lipid-binding SYLF domain-containing protein